MPVLKINAVEAQRKDATSEQRKKAAAGRVRGAVRIEVKEVGAVVRTADKALTCPTLSDVKIQGKCG